MPNLLRTSLSRRSAPCRLLLLASLLLVFATGAEAQSWTEGPSMNVARSDAAVAVLGGQLYVIGGRTTTNQPLGVVERFDPASGTWSSVGTLRDERYAAAAAPFQGGIVLMGGREDGGVTDDVEFYNLGEDDWESFDHLEQARQGLAAAVLNGHVFALGGAGQSGTFLTTCEGYDPADEDWYIYPQWTLTPGRASFGAATIGASAYLAGGFSQFGPLDLFERYELGNGSTPLEPLPTARGGLSLVHTGGALGGDLFAIGGRDVNGVVGTVTRYDVAGGDWETVAPLLTGREGAVAAFLDGAIYVVGGRDYYGSALRTMEVFQLSTDAEDPAAPRSLALDAPHPNPFAARTTLTFRLDEAAPVTLTVYDVQGRAVARLVDAPKPSGTHHVEWDGTAADGRRLPAGVYFARLAAPSGSVVARLTILR